MLKRTAAATAEMRARRVGAPFPSVQPFDNSALPSSTSTGTELRANAVAGYREWQKHRFAIVLGESVPTRPDPRSDELNGCVRAMVFPQLSAPCRMAVLILRSPSRMASRRGDG